MSSKIVHEWCLTCNKLYSRVKVAFYGDWNCCQCPKPWQEQKRWAKEGYKIPFILYEFYSKHRCFDNNPIFSLGTLPPHGEGKTRRPIMKWEVKTELVVQEKNDKEKKAMIVKYSTMDVHADDFEGASTAAKELCLEGESITSIAVILEE